ncbi:MAG TPA: glycosyltransferase family 4 protein [Acidimicrobiales bacterium]|nr:glycosyltransferase family 4 protein [Acidimicrobiales bacterium]
MAEQGEIAPPPRLVHLTTTDMSLAMLLGPQLEAFAAAGFEVIGVSASGPFVTVLKARGVRHVPLRHATRAAAPYHDLQALGELVRLFRRLVPDIVHTHNPKPGVYGRLAARAAGVPAVVNTVHGLYALPEDRWAKRAVVYGLERVAATCSHAELVQNPEDIETLASLGVPRSKLHLLGNGVDLRRFDVDRGRCRRQRVRAELGFGPDDVVVGAVGRLVAEKGYLELFQAATVVMASRSNARFLVAGPADLDKGDALSSEVIGRAQAAGVRFLGFRSDVEDLYSAMDVYVLASHREGFPRSAMEAAAMALPVVATDVRGCRQVVDDRVSGLLVPVGDAAALAAAIDELVASATLRRSMGRASRAKAVAEFDQRRVIDLTLDVYASLLRPRPPGLVLRP